MFIIKHCPKCKHEYRPIDKWQSCPRCRKPFWEWVSEYELFLAVAVVCILVALVVL